MTGGDPSETGGRQGSAAPGPGPVRGPGAGREDEAAGLPAPFPVLAAQRRARR